MCAMAFNYKSCFPAPSQRNLNLNDFQPRDPRCWALVRKRTADYQARDISVHPLNHHGDMLCCGTFSFAATLKLICTSNLDTNQDLGMRICSMLLTSMSRACISSMI